MDHQTLSDDEEYFNLQIEHEIKRDLIANNITRLYHAVLTPFQRGELIVYHSYIFSELTLERFFDWIIKNNSQISTLF